MQRCTQPRPTRRFLFALGVCLCASGLAVPHQLSVPFFRDDGGHMVDSVPSLGGIAGFVTVRNTHGDPVTMFLVYSQSDPTGSVVIQQAVSFSLAAYSVVHFRPVQDDPVEGGSRATHFVRCPIGI